MIDWHNHHYLEEAKVEEAEVEYVRWLSQRGDNFTSLLFILIGKSDPQNIQKLAQVYPNEVYVVARRMEHPILKRFTVLPGSKEPRGNY